MEKWERVLSREFISSDFGALGVVNIAAFSLQCVWLCVCMCVTVSGGRVIRDYSVPGH